MKHIFLIPLTLFLLLTLAACGGGPLAQPVAVATSAPTATAAPTVAITPTPTIPTVPSRPVQFQTPDHIQLAGLLWGQGKTFVICSHELRTSKLIWQRSGLPQLLATRGYQVLTYDFRGNADSGGTNDVNKLDVDLHAAVAFARLQGATKIVLMGSSMGGTATLNVASTEHVAAVVTLSAPQMFGPNVTDAQVQAISAPKLFINSKDDDYASDTQHMYDIASQPKAIHLYDGSAHGTAIFDETEFDADLVQRILTFIGQYAPA
ncbi:MAG TPA: alpha/beta fold hydrolase [Ktedonosporobacter sp.]|nr:alpha/beta fold hydrolase [Ktedonosporobacter sp.]